VGLRVKNATSLVKISIGVDDVPVGEEGGGSGWL